MSIRRRDILKGLGAGLGAAPFAASFAAPTQKRPQLAGVVTVYRRMSHAQHIIDRYLEGYGWAGEYHYPPMDLVSLYVDQVGGDDLSRDRGRRHPSMKIYPTIAEALT
ncbi:MAG: hypothetical protein ABI165_06500, partial [Bryobacteraceae bacterium]